MFYFGNGLIFLLSKCLIPIITFELLLWTITFLVASQQIQKGKRSFLSFSILFQSRHSDLMLRFDIIRLHISCYFRQSNTSSSWCIFQLSFTFAMRISLSVLLIAKTIPTIAYFVSWLAQFICRLFDLILYLSFNASCCGLIWRTDLDFFHYSLGIRVQLVGMNAVMYWIGSCLQSFLLFVLEVILDCVFLLLFLAIDSRKGLKCGLRDWI